MFSGRLPQNKSEVAYWIAIVLLFVLAAWQRFSLPLEPLTDPDVWGYIAPALGKLGGGEFVHIDERNFVYPGFVYLVLRVFGDFRAITIIQHLLGLAAGCLLLLTWRRVRVFAGASRLNGRTHNVVGLIATALFLLAAEPIRAEMRLRPEGICAFLHALNIWCAIEFIARTFVKRRAPPVGFGIGVVVTAIVLASVKPSFIFLGLVPLVPLGIAFLRRGFLREKIGLAVGAGAGAFLLLLPEHFFKLEDDQRGVFLSTNLFVVHADLIRDQMAEDLAQHAELPYEREWLSGIHANLSLEIAKSTAAHPEHYRVFGFCPDYLAYEEDSIVRGRRAQFPEQTERFTGLCSFYFWRTWQQRPVAMMRKVVRQLALFYAPACPAYDRGKTFPLAIWYQVGVSNLNTREYPNLWKTYRPAVEFMHRSEALSQTAPAMEQRRVLRKALALLARSYLPLLTATLVLGAITLFRRDERKRLGWLVLLALFLFSYNAAAALQVALLNSLEVPRYSSVQVYFTLLAEFLAIRLLSEAVLGWRKFTASATG